MTAKPHALDPEEPAKIAEAVRLMGLKFAVVTGVARDDLDDGASAHWAEIDPCDQERCPTAASRC